MFFRNYYEFKKILKQDDSENILKKVLEEPTEFDDDIEMSDDEDLPIVMYDDTE